MKIANIVATVTLNTSLDLVLVHELLPQTEFHGKSPWLKMRLPPNNTYIAFYKSGKFLITSKDPEKISEIAEMVLLLLQRAGIDVRIVKSEIHNIVVQATIPLKMPLETLIANLDPKKASYEPEQFPALVYKDWGVSFLIFSSGKIIIAGLKDFKMVEEKIKKLIEITGVR